LLRADANEVVGKNFLETSPMRRNSPDAWNSSRSKRRS